MSIERCYVCERNVDTDYEEVLYWNDAPWCQRCLDIPGSNACAQIPNISDIGRQIDEYFKGVK